MIQLKDPCKHCGHLTGRIETRGGQDMAICLGCGRFTGWNVPKTVTGREIRSLRTRPDIKPGQRARILDRDSARCIICGRGTADCHLDIGHIVSVEDAKRLEWPDHVTYDDENLAAMCASCNSGYSSVSINPRIFAALVMARIQRKADA